MMLDQWIKARVRDPGFTWLVVVTHQTNVGVYRWDVDAAGNVVDENDPPAPVEPDVFDQALGVVPGVAGEPAPNERSSMFIVRGERPILPLGRPLFDLPHNVQRLIRRSPQEGRFVRAPVAWRWTGRPGDDALMGVGVRSGLRPRDMTQRLILADRFEDLGMDVEAQYQREVVRVFEETLDTMRGALIVEPDTLTSYTRTVVAGRGLTVEIPDRHAIAQEVVARIQSEA